MPAIITTAEQIAALSAWIDEAPRNASKSVTEQLWARTGKIAEELGEVIENVIAFAGQNPRKPQDTSPERWDGIRKELLDVALTALAAVEHLSYNEGSALAQLDDHVQGVYERAGLGA